MVEFTIVLPCLLVILCAVVDIGRIVDAKVLVQSAASEGIRHIVSTTDVNTQVMNSISDYSDRLDFSKLTISSTVGSTVEPHYDYHVDSGSSWTPVDSYLTYKDVNVRLQYDLPLIMPLTKLFLGNVFTMSTTYNCQLFLSGYPQWTPTYTVTYSRNGGSGTVPVDSGAYHTGDPVTVLSQGGVYRTGYVFKGWNTSSSGNGTNYSPGATFNMGSANVTLYAKWGH